jgi:hypothetical protein
MIDRETIRLGLAGDLMLGGEAARYARERSRGVTRSFDALVPALSALDFLFLNLEGPLFENAAAALPRPFLLSNPPEVVEVLKRPKICVCSLANNHSLDYGPDALFKTQRYLDKHGIHHLGAGRNAEEAGRELVLEYLGWRIGCLAFTDSGPRLVPVLASRKRAGCAGLPDQSILVERVRRLSAQVDLVVVMLHWGLEFYEYPTPAQVRLARALVDAGAHLIAGHHPHAIQPVEEYNGGIIAYSLGHLFMPPFRLSMNRPLIPALSLSEGERLSRRRAPNGCNESQTPSSRPNDGPVFYPRPSSKEFLLMRVKVPSGFPNSPGAVDVVAGGLDAHFNLRPYNRIGLQSFRARLDNLTCPLANGGYSKFWRHYRSWRQEELQVLMASAK